MFANDSDNRRHTVEARVMILAILLIATAWQCIGAWTDSQTTDEAVHLSAGYSYWRTGDFRMNPEHPPLFKLLAAAPLLAVPHLNFSTNSIQWQTAEQWGLGSILLYNSGDSPRDAQWILFIGRLVPIVIWLVLAVVIALTAWRRWGQWAGVLAVGLYAFDPNFLGHGHLVTNDVAMCLAFLGTMLSFERFLVRPSWTRLVVASGVFGLALVTKFSSVILLGIVPIVLFIAAARREHPLSWTWLRRSLVAILVVVPLIGWATYGFEVKPADTDTRISQPLDSAARNAVPTTDDSVLPLTRWLSKAGNLATTEGRVVQFARHLPVPAYSYFVGLGNTAAHDYYGHTAFLLGQVRTYGWWYYFPVAMAVKLPIVSIFLLFVVAILGIPRLRRDWRRLFGSTAWWCIGFPPVLFLLWSLTSHINIGVRHVFPFMVFLPIWASSILSRPFFTPRRAMAVSVSVVSLLFLTSLFAWPHTLAYFNAFVGGTNNGHTVLQDSNLDWNQDTWRLRSYVTQKGLTSYGLAIPNGRHELFFPEAATVPTDGDVGSGLKPKGVFLISEAVLYDADNQFHWLWNIKPTAQIASTIYRFDFR